ncbi:MAG: hypothetical protein KBS85_06960 [Lachnospiraceae bacterium]|nr:hypothetical protein [Candidatus Merdinaster equi]
MKSIKRILAALLVVAMAVTMMPTEVKSEAAGKNSVTMSVVACQITPDLQTVAVYGSGKVPASDDGKMYLFAEPTYSSGITTNPVAVVAASGSPVFGAPLGEGTANSLLYKKFCIGVPQGGKYVKVSNFSYITNPQVLSTFTSGNRIVTTSKKGLFPDPLRLEQLQATGAQHTQYQLLLSDLITTRTTGVVPYQYNGKVYCFDAGIVQQYDYLCSYCQQRNISMSMVILLGYKKNLEVLVNPLSRATRSKARTYLLPNASEQLGVEYLAAAYAFLAERYNGLSGHGQIDNFIVGNEVTAFVQWNYIPAGTSLATYVEEYAKVLRVAYTAVKSKNKAAQVYTSVDQRYNRNEKINTVFDTRDFLEALAANTAAQGNFSWGVSVHPYNCPLTSAKWWSKSSYYARMVNHTQNTPYLTMENLEVLTDFMCTPAMLTSAGKCRPIIIDEIGYPSSEGEKNQAAAIVYAYKQAEANQYIKAIVFHNTTDNAEEVQQGLAEGLLNMNGTPKVAYSWFTGMDGAQGATYVQQAKGVIGAKWNIIPR